MSNPIADPAEESSCLCIVRGCATPAVLEPRLVEVPRSERFYFALEFMPALRRDDCLLSRAGDFPGVTELERGKLVAVAVEAS